ncbi:conjugal transfer protein TraR [Gordonia sp. HNM0687]|uniref:Conjugal transfer protein TraR n=1 Tax=Gordonia mangrovi TaxID=2665643 RepID=A0A6L7GTF1_9ACTN|nr:TraR/DksA C4-type zinc finger protein [Gordonia mangrovi]MXP22742.1 conjugal transfer protein TraR [Gordonia mangrovi]UVF77058.1 TraR/DksA family transcriptional regulator [Gordonia mangrovi]
MTTHDPDRIHDTLHRERSETVSLIDQLSARLDAVIEATADSSSDDEHDPEGSTLAVERGHLVAQLERSRVRLDELDAASIRVTAGTYGQCENCGSPIAEARLEALPAARLCIDCASRGSARRW